MKKSGLIAALAFVLAGPAFAADPVEGTWQTAPDDNGNFGHIVVKPCGERFCGTLMRAFDSAGKPMQSPNVGRQIVWDMKPLGNGKYGKGKVWSPDRDKTYNSRMELKGDMLAVSGCILGICRDGGKWRRVK